MKLQKDSFSHLVLDDFWAISNESDLNNILNAVFCEVLILFWGFFDCGAITVLNVDRDFFFESNKNW